MQDVEKNTIDFSRIKLLVLDVDGVLSPGEILVDSNGGESKRFDMQDGHGLRMWNRAGGKTALLSGRTAAATEKFAKTWPIDFCMQECHRKSEAFDELLEKAQVDAGEAAFVGDDVVDLPVIRRAAFGVAVANAVAELKRFADYVTLAKGGHGAVRETIELIMKRSGAWDKAMQRYGPADNE